MFDMVTDAAGRMFWIVAAALCSFALPFLISWLKHIRKPELVGEWQSLYQGIDDASETWVKEKVKISTYATQLKFRNANNSHNYDYTAYGKVLRGDFIVGEWTSIRSGSNAHGGFILSIASQGDALYGYWVGPDFGGTKRYGQWVLGKDASALQLAQEELKRATQPRIGGQIKTELLPPDRS